MWPRYEYPFNVTDHDEKLVSTVVTGIRNNMVLGFTPTGRDTRASLNLK